MNKFIRSLLLVIAFTSCEIAAAQVTFVIDELPKATPLEDTLFISGSFNNWNIKNENYLLKKRLDGKYAVTLPKGEGTIQFKFHRGSWSKVETNAKNDYIPNRTFTFGNGKTVMVAIDNWQDVGGAKSFDVFTYYFFTIVFAAITIIFLIYRSKAKKKSLSNALLLFLIFISLILFGRVVFEIISLKWQYYFTLAAEFLLFISGPLWYFILSPSRLSRKSVVLHALPPAIILMVIFLKVNNVAGLQFLTGFAINKVLTWNAVLFFGCGMVSNTVYFSLGLSKYEILKFKTDLLLPNLFLLKYHIYAGSLFMILQSVKLILLLGGKEHILYWFDRDVIFLSATSFVLVVGYYLFLQESGLKSAPIPLKIDDLDSLKNMLDTAMRDKKSFRDPHLTLTELSEIVNIKPHALSRIINECYKQNFRDYVNRYRVEEFIAIAQQDFNKRYTFLALANEVGFNSKSTFNAAFKKVTQQSPRDFFRSNKELAY
jgi:AraC-like DNA-binding protein